MPKLKPLDPVKPGKEPQAVLAKRPRRSRQPPAVQSHFYLAEEFRSEVNGLVTAIGLYPEETVVLLARSEPAFDPGEVPLKHLVGRLAFMVTVRCDAGSHAVSVWMAQPDQSPDNYKQLVQEDIVFSDTNEVVNFVFKFSPYKVETLGEHALVVRVGDSYEHRHNFRLKERPAKPPPVPPALGKT